MRKRARTLGSFLVLVGLVATSNADTRYFSGTECLGNSAGDSQYAHRTNEGCSNSYLTGVTSPCSTTLLLIWPIVGNSSDTIDYNQIDISYHSTTGLTLTCYSDVTTSAGTTYAGNSAATSGTGYGTLSLTGNQLPNSGSSISSARVQHAYCYVPGAVNVVDVGCTGTTEILGVKITTQNAF